MDLQTLISPEEAERHLAAYERQLASERTREDDAIRRGYEAAARGLQVISLPAAIAAGGWFPSGLPRLACVRANATTCYGKVSGYSERQGWLADDRCAVSFCAVEDDRGNAPVGRWRVEVTVPSAADQSWRGVPRGRTIVPTIPPDVRPRRNRLHLFHVLWEVTEWQPTPPVDPALIRHLGGDLWTVHATWDLTELERAVLAGRAT